MLLNRPLGLAVLLLQRKEINILKRVSFNRNVVQFYGFCLEEQAPMLVRSMERPYEYSMSRHLHGFLMATQLFVATTCSAAAAQHLQH